MQPLMVAAYCGTVVYISLFLIYTLKLVNYIEESESESNAMCILSSSVIKYNTVLALIQVPPKIIIEIKITVLKQHF